jgi:hypothetical protein
MWYNASVSLKVQELGPHLQSLVCIRFHASSFYSRHENAPVYHREKHLDGRVDFFSVLEM